MMDRRGFLIGAGATGGLLAAGGAMTMSHADGSSGGGEKATLAGLPAADGADGNPGRIAAAKGLCFGSCISARPLAQDKAYATTHARYCNTLVHASALQWHELQRAPRAAYNFRDADRILAWGRERSLPFRGHLMLDWAGLPGWLEPAIDSLSPSSAEKLLRSHVIRIGARYRGRMLQWNVANEPMSGHKVRDYGWHRKLGESYLDIAFAAAAEADPGVPLTINQNLIEMQSGYQRRGRDGLLELIQRMKARGVPLASVGVQGHLLSREGKVDQYGMDGFLRELKAMNIAFMITEMDVDDRGFSRDIAERDASSAAMVRDFLDVTLAHSHCEGLICWGLFDHYNWINKEPQRARTDGARQRPAPFDLNYRPKPMWDVIVQALRRAPGPGARTLLKRS